MSYAFPFDTLTDATLEFYVNPSSVAYEQDIFWTTTGVGDTNRFNIVIFPGGSVHVDYRDSGGTLHPLVDTGGGAITANQWNFVAIVKSGNTYSVYVNTLAAVTNTDSSPNLPTSTGWTINGRGAFQFSGLIDEIRLSDQALSPSQFLSSAPKPRFNICLLYDPTKAKQSGATVPIKLQLCDSSGNDLSSSSTIVHAISVTQISTSISGPVENSGNANPDNNFRFDSGLGNMGGYIFNLKTTGLPTGTYNINFKVTGDSALYAVPFQVK